MQPQARVIWGWRHEWLTPIVEYGFDDPAKLDGVKSSGLDDATSLFALLTAGRKDIAPRGAAGSGVTGQPDDYACELSDTGGMGQQWGFCAT